MEPPLCASMAALMHSRRALFLASLLLSLMSLAAAGCKKKEGDPTATAGVDDPWAKPIDPWAGPPPGAVAIAAKDGEQLAKLTVAAAPAEPAAEPADGAAPPPPGGSMPGMKIDFGKIAAPEPEKLELRGFGTIKPTGFSVTYNPSTNAAHEEYRKLLEGNRVFETFAERLNKTIRIPNQVDIQLVDCNTINAFYDPNGKRIIVCYELVDYFLRVFKPVAKTNDELGSAVFGAVAFSFFHEVGHSLIDQLELPAVGREEDSADQIATLTLIGTGDEGVGMALSGAYWFQLQQKGGNETPFWDEHAFDGQRFYNIVCLIYGSDPEKYANFVASGTLPAARAKRCPEEYAKIGKAWNKLLASHFTSSGAENAGTRVAANEPPAAEPEPTAVAAADPATVEPADPAAAEPDPSDPAAQAPSAPAVQRKHSISCEQVAEKASELIGAELEQRVRSMSDAEKLEVQHKLETELPAALETILAQCRSDDWADTSRLCVINATTLAEASDCN
jgi:Putative metallopeptidase